MTSEPKTPNPEADQLAEEDLDSVSGGAQIGTVGASTVGPSSVKSGSQSSSLGQIGGSGANTQPKSPIQRT